MPEPRQLPVLPFPASSSTLGSPTPHGSPGLPPDPRGQPRRSRLLTGLMPAETVSSARAEAAPAVPSAGPGTERACTPPAESAEMRAFTGCAVIRTQCDRLSRLRAAQGRWLRGHVACVCMPVPACKCLRVCVHGVCVHVQCATTWACASALLHTCACKCACCHVSFMVAQARAVTALPPNLPCWCHPGALCGYSTPGMFWVPRQAAARSRPRSPTPQEQNVLH